MPQIQIWQISRKNIDQLSGYPCQQNQNYSLIVCFIWLMAAIFSFFCVFIHRFRFLISPTQSPKTKESGAKSSLLILRSFFSFWSDQIFFLASFNHSSASVPQILPWGFGYRDANCKTLVKNRNRTLILIFRRLIFATTKFILVVWQVTMDFAFLFPGNFVMTVESCYFICL